VIDVLRYNERSGGDTGVIGSMLDGLAVNSISSI
jgi:hypothetical protein